MAKTLLKVENIVKRFGGLYAVDGTSLEVGANSIVGLVGPNGCGKTTLLSTIYGIQHADSGSVIFDNQSISGLSPHQIFARGMVNAFQFPRLFFRLSVLDNMVIAARGHRGDSLANSIFRRRDWQKQETEIVERSLEILDMLGLDHLTFNPAGSLSGGQKKLLEIGRSLLAQPKLLLLDEPAAGVNPVLGKTIFAHLEQSRQSGVSFLIIEHRLELLMEYATWVYVMDRGHIVLQGKPQDVVNSPEFYEVYIGGGAN